MRSVSYSDITFLVR